MGGALQVALLETRLHLRLANAKIFLLVLIVGVLLGALAPQLQDRGVHPDAGLYRVEVTAGSPLLPALEGDPKFDVRLGSASAGLEADLFVDGVSVYFDPGSQKSHAAARELEISVQRWLNVALATENDVGAAFPVRVNVVYVPRAGVAAPAPTPTPTGMATTAPGSPSPATPAPALVDDPTLPTAGDRQLGLRPDQIEPPFPIRSLLLAFVYVVPMTFVGQLYAGSLLEDRTRQRALLLLSTPHRHGAVLFGKSLPYAVVTVAVAAATTVYIGADVFGFLAALSFLGLLFAAALLFGILARSARELTFLLVSVTVLLNTYLFLPPIFSPLPAVAYLSPVSVILASLRGETVPPELFVYATLPLTLLTVTLLLLATALYREETLFAPRPMLAKVGDAVRRLTPDRIRLLGAGILAVPFAFALELFVLLLAVSLNLRAALIVFLIGGAFVEEGLKGLVSYAHLTRARARSPAVTSALVGTGFFLGEKGVLALVLLGFGALPLAPEALATFGIAQTALVVLAPLVLHVGANFIVARAAAKGKGASFRAWAVAGLVHASYNLSILWLGLSGVLR